VADIPLLSPNPNELSLISSVDLKEQIIGVLLKSGKKEPAGNVLENTFYKLFVKFSLMGRSCPLHFFVEPGYIRLLRTFARNFSSKDQRSNSGKTEILVRCNLSLLCLKVM